MVLNDQQLERYARHIILKEVGGAGQQKLLQARVLVIGAGGLGSPLLMYLAAAGVGHIGIVDDDEVELSNLQRQIIHVTNNLHQAKTVSAAQHIAALNPDVTIHQHSLRLTADNVDNVIRGYDIIADGCDNFETRFLINAACHRARIPLVSAALSQFEGQLSTFRSYEDDKPCYQCLVPTLPPPDSVQSCAEAGILGAVAGVMGSLQAVEVMKEIVGLDDSLAGKLLLYDALSARSRLIKLPKDPACPCCGTQAK
ncbi:MAG: adenylyltransferase [Kordiimonas sp.]|nr:adenylyltransferase [Kordiimonas sp.]|tara:strand:+ start:630 stop:1394 length:765 start_codon:yes stop_codon:yes gene_type:complete